ncbi:TAXI family TRAP transporter solute-binding subunit [Spiractinospora alimapuensis]|uniref:TAXI family TRAP transporter solute-binding subunit n=1 Tax=Spiractinospora alimapuensis TaxID=2820884 RepID=UPI001F48F5D6|nr:TAXI family TRAP transporter solute-binding subunit [Spiractinospora alimapuensis]QVQ53514.1 TAXI family TRAP transporter solute-binding subunit [Spiractinospora alimapuensis]
MQWTPGRRTALLTLAGAATAAITGCARAPEGAVDRLVVATGPPGAVYREIGSELAALLDEHLDEIEVVTMETRASHDNLFLLADGEAHLGLANLDSILSAGVADGDDVFAVGRLYDSFVHLVVPGDSPVRSLTDLDGRRVSVGAVNSGTEFTAAQLIGEIGLDVEERRLDQAASAAALTSGDIDAMFSLTGLPTPAVATAAEEGRIRLIDLSAAADALADVSPEAYFPASIPATTYDGVPACPTVSVPNLLLCGAALPDSLVRVVTGTLYAGVDRLSAQRPEAAQINVRTGISTGIVPLHPGASQWYRDQKPA